MPAAERAEMVYSEAHFEALKRDLQEARSKLQAKRELQNQQHRDFPVTLAATAKT
jgi:hypothetical protein